MPFNPGDAVHVAALGKGIVREVRNGGRYLVELKGRTLVAAASQLTLQDEPRQKRGRVTARATDQATAGRRHAANSIDLHGMTADEAVATVDLFLNDALLASLEEVRIVHGRSGGRLRTAVHARLRQLPSIRAFRLDPSNHGVTIVTL
jgi:DNA mismatch repair protein MutS2